MKKYLFLISSLLFITACDIIEGPYITDANSYVNPDKKVLIEDFTGHKCKNCPTAARELEAIHNLYGDQIIGLAIHLTNDFAGTNPLGSASTPYTYDFRTEWGDNLNDLYNFDMLGLPKGMVNRIGHPEDQVLSRDEWASVVANELQKEVDFLITIEADTNTINILSIIENDVVNNYNLFVCLTESNIINWQTDEEHPGEHNPNYEHNHVLRTVIYNNKLSDQDDLKKGDLIENTFNIKLTELEQYNINYSLNNPTPGSATGGGNGNAGGWVANNMSVIAYIYNTETQEIAQVQEVHLNN